MKIKSVEQEKELSQQQARLLDHSALDYIYGGFDGGRSGDIIGDIDRSAGSN